MSKFILSDESINSYGFIIKTSGGRFERFSKNPIMFYNHDYSQILGMWEIEQDGAQLIGNPIFDVEDTFANDIKGKVERGFLKGASIGIDILKYEIPTDARQPIAITEWELLEASITPMPSNKNAVKMSYKGETFNISNKKERKSLNLSLNSNINNMDKLELSLGDAVLHLEDTDTSKQIVEYIADVTSKMAEMSGKYTELTLKVAQLEEAENLIKVENTELSGKVTEFERKEKTTFIENCITSGKFNKDQKDTLLLLSETNFDAVKKLADAAEFKAVEKITIDVKDNSSVHNFGKMTSEQRKELKASNPELYEEYVKQYVN